VSPQNEKFELADHIDQYAMKYASIGVVVHGNELQVTGANNHASRLFGVFHKFKNKQECATNLAEYPRLFEVALPGGEVVPLEEWPVSRALRGEKVSNAEYCLRRKDTGDVWMGSYSFAPIRG
jgi:hypothetical protein